MFVWSIPCFRAGSVTPDGWPAAAVSRPTGPGGGCENGPGSWPAPGPVVAGDARDGAPGTAADGPCARIGLVAHHRCAGGADAWRAAAVAFAADSAGAATAATPTAAASGTSGLGTRRPCRPTRSRSRSLRRRYTGAVAETSCSAAAASVLGPATIRLDEIGESSLTVNTQHV